VHAGNKGVPDVYSHVKNFTCPPHRGPPSPPREIYASSRGLLLAPINVQHIIIIIIIKDRFSLL